MAPPWSKADLRNELVRRRLHLDSTLAQLELVIRRGSRGDAADRDRIALLASVDLDRLALGAFERCA